MTLLVNEFASQEALVEEFASTITALLREGIKEKGRASLVVSGGRTPIALFNKLSTSQLPWENVDVTLADERWVDASDDASNEKLVRTHLLKDNAANANFVSLTTSDNDANNAVGEISQRVTNISSPFDVLILGMGEDGHTASLFPCAKQIKEGLTTEADCLAVTPGEAPHQRMSLSLKKLLESKRIFLHLTGNSKKRVVEQAQSGDDPYEMPIRAIIQNAQVELMWAP
ncbi:6-phosphogluconolactonase [Aestuariibacter sp. AA17]|uniref:6-phosphogluconolactonase n=1 Tax=Fluctibacter corallii TaxID=2984329 RepID=A0ABT3A6E0_9ALTE|nr:6-phosphogluconolactonase [Aestuariibacter sp. AA17]MCV2884253.1 6-phosphogluconolactonase [Aestuariibacter sp. AA17]